VPAFDVEAFKHAAADEIQKSRVGEHWLDQAKLARFIRENSWEAVGQRFIDTIKSLGG
jgi:hypothetical protein